VLTRNSAFAWGIMGLQAARETQEQELDRAGTPALASDDQTGGIAHSRGDETAAPVAAAVPADEICYANEARQLLAALAKMNAGVREVVGSEPAFTTKHSTAKCTIM
jgi:hypothetical protein